MRRASTTAGLLILALLPVAAAVSPEAPVSSVPMNVMQPITPVSVTTPLAPTGGLGTSESELLVAVGGALMALAAIVRRTGRAS